MNPYYKGGKKEDWKGKEDDKDKGVNCANQWNYYYYWKYA